MSERLICRDCTATFGAERDAERHEADTGHEVRAVDMSRHAADVRRSERLDAHGPPRGDY